MYDNIIQNEDLQLAAQKKFNKAEGFKERFIAYIRNAIACSNVYLSDKNVKEADDFGYKNGVWYGLFCIDFCKDCNDKCEYIFDISIDAVCSHNFNVVLSSKKQEKLEICFDYRNTATSNENFDKIIKYVQTEINMKMDF